MGRHGATPSYGQVPRALGALAAGCFLGFQTVSMGPRVALEDSGVTFRPEEVTEEMGGCFQEGPGSIWKD